MTKARKIILLVAGTWIAYLILFPPARGLLSVKNGHILNEPIPWPEVVLIAFAAVVALLITKIPNPGGKE